MSSGTISACYATGNAEATATTGNAFAGGFVGSTIGNITACYSIGDATATGSNATFVGGFVGSGRNITACYSIGDATATGNTTFVGGFEGFNEDSIRKSYFDHETSNRPETDIGAQTTSDLQSPTDYTGIYQGWNLDPDNDSSPDDPWNFGTNAEYPVLKIVTLDLNSSPSPPVADPSTIEGRVTALEAEITALKTELEALKAKIAAFEAATGGRSTAIYNVPGVSASARVYPNPAKHSLLFANLTPGRVYLYKIYTSSGVLLRSDAVQSDEAIDISTLEAGQYLLVLQDDDSHEVLRSSLLIE